MPHPGDVRVSAFVDECNLWPARDDGIDVHVLVHTSAVFDLQPRDHLESPDSGLRERPCVGLDEADHDVLALTAPIGTLAEHGECLARAGRRAEVDAEMPTPWWPPTTCGERCGGGRPGGRCDIAHSISVAPVPRRQTQGCFTRDEHG